MMMAMGRYKKVMSMDVKEAPMKKKKTKKAAKEDKKPSKEVSNPLTSKLN